MIWHRSRRSAADRPQSVIVRMQVSRFSEGNPGQSLLLLRKKDSHFYLWGYGLLEKFMILHESRNAIHGWSYVRSQNYTIFTLIFFFSKFIKKLKNLKVPKAQIIFDQSCDKLTLFWPNMTLRKDSFELFFNYIMWSNVITWSYLEEIFLARGWWPDLQPSSRSRSREKFEIFFSDFSQHFLALTKKL